MCEEVHETRVFSLHEHVYVSTCVCVFTRYIKREFFPSLLDMAIEVDALSPSEQRCYACLCALFQKENKIWIPFLVDGDDLELSCFFRFLWIPVLNSEVYFLMSRALG